MKDIKRKLRSQRGETLVEVLAAVLVAALSVSMLLGGVAVSGKINGKAQGTDQYFYETLTQAESRQTPVTDGITARPSVKVSENMVTAEIPIQVYGDKGLYSYALTPAGGDGP